MKTRLFWKDCDLNEGKDSFWVECSDEEVKKLILPYLNKDKNRIKQDIKMNRGSNKINKNEEEKDLCNFFLISYDYQHIESFSWQMPYSGLWNAYNPFKEFDVIDFNDLEELPLILKKTNLW